MCATRAISAGSRGDDRLGACRRAPPLGAGRRIRLAPGQCGDRGGARRRRAPDPRGDLAMEGRRLPRRGDARRRRPRQQRHPHPRDGDQARQRSDDRSLQLASRGQELHQLVLPEHVFLGGRCAVLPDRPGHAEERRRLPPADRNRETRHGRVGQSWGAGHPGDQSLRPGDYRGDHQGIGAGLPRPPDGRLGPRFRIAIQGKDPRSDKPFIWHFFQARPGGGASPAGDGWPGAGEWQAAGGIKFGSLEVTEVRFPLFFRRHEFCPDSGGQANIAADPAGSSRWSSKPPKRRWATPPGTVCATGLAASLWHRRPAASLYALLGWAAGTRDKDQGNRSRHPPQ